MGRSTISKGARVAACALAACALALGALGALGQPGQAEAKAKKPAQVKVSSATIEKSGTVTVEIKKAARAKSYQYQVATDKKFKKGKKTKSAKKPAAVEFSKLKYTKTYYARARAKNASGWGKWSKTAKVKQAKTAAIVKKHDYIPAEHCPHSLANMTVKERVGFFYVIPSLLEPAKNPSTWDYDMDLDTEHKARIAFYNYPDDPLPSFGAGKFCEYKQLDDGTWGWTEQDCTREVDRSVYPRELVYTLADGEVVRFEYAEQGYENINNVPVTCSVCERCGMIEREVTDIHTEQNSTLNQRHYNFATGTNENFLIYKPGVSLGNGWVLYCYRDADGKLEQKSYSR